MNDDPSTIIITPTLRAEIAAEFDATVEEAVVGLLKQMAVINGLRTTEDGHSLADALAKAQDLMSGDPASLAAELAANVIRPLFPEAEIIPGRISPPDGKGFGIALVVRERQEDTAQLALPLDAGSN